MADIKPRCRSEKVRFPFESGLFLRQNQKGDFVAQPMTAEGGVDNSHGPFIFPQLDPTILEAAGGITRQLWRSCRRCSIVLLTLDLKNYQWDFLVPRQTNCPWGYDLNLNDPQLHEWLANRRLAGSVLTTILTDVDDILDEAPKLQGVHVMFNPDVDWFAPQYCLRTGVDLLPVPMDYIISNVPPASFSKVLPQFRLVNDRE